MERSSAQYSKIYHKHKRKVNWRKEDSRSKYYQVPRQVQGRFYEEEQEQKESEEQAAEVAVSNCYTDLEKRQPKKKVKQILSERDSNEKGSLTSFVQARLAMKGQRTHDGMRRFIILSFLIHFHEFYILISSYIWKENG